MCNVETGKIDFLSAHTLNRKFLEYKRQQRGLYVYYVTGIKCVRHVEHTSRTDLCVVNYRIVMIRKFSGLLFVENTHENPQNTRKLIFIHI